MTLHQLLQKTYSIVAKTYCFLSQDQTVQVSIDTAN